MIKLKDFIDTVDECVVYIVNSDFEDIIGGYVYDIDFSDYYDFYIQYIFANGTDEFRVVLFTKNES